MSDSQAPLLRRTFRRIRRHYLLMTGRNLKIYGCVTMLFYTISMSIVENGLIHVNAYTADGLTQAMAADGHLMMLSTWATVLRLLGGLALPVFAFLLVEGFVHTSSFKRYLLTMLAFAVISEIPYDLAMDDALWSVSGQNVMFTYAICLVMLYGLRMFVGKKGLRFRLAQLFIVLAAILWGELLQSAFSLITVLLCAVYYLFYEEKSKRVLYGCAVSALYVTAIFSGYALWNYAGERGKIRNKYVFYALYPAHLLLLGIIAHFMAR